MKHRKLQIAWLVAWGVAAALIVVLWVRSYWYQDVLVLRPGSVPSFGGISCAGRFLLGVDGTADLHGVILSGLYLPHHLWLSEEWDKHPTCYGFASKRFPGGWNIEIPYYFVLVVLGVIAWLGWPRFSLRTLLIVTTLVGCLLGLNVYVTGNLH